MRLITCLVVLWTFLVIPYSSEVSNISYVGCYDLDYALEQDYHNHILLVTLDNCVQYCRALNTTKYAGVEASDNFCYCGNDIAEESVQENDALCDVQCPDESLRTCGGTWKMSLYEIRGTYAVVPAIDNSSAVVNTSYVGCYDLTFSTEQGYHYSIASVTLDKCVQFCRALDTTKYAGVEASDNLCYCGDDIAEESERIRNTLCNVLCPDESLRTCGGEHMMSLYDIRRISAEDTSDHVDFLIGTLDGVRVYNSANHWTTFDTLTPPTSVFSVDYHLSRNLLFYFTKQMIFKTTLDHNRGIMETAQNGNLTKEPSTCQGFAVDWVHDRIYWAVCNPNGTTIKSMGLEGEDEQVLLTRAERTHVTRMEIDPYKRVVFWTASGVIQSCKVSGEGFIANMSKAGVFVSVLALDLQLRRVYYIGLQKRLSVSLYSMDYAGGDDVEHYILPNLKIARGLSIVGGKVFWLIHNNARDLIYKAPVNLTRVEDAKILTEIDPVVHMRVVHPSLQRRPRVDPCLDKGCVHGCVVQGSTAQCECPPGQELHPDGVSCHYLEKNNDHQTAAGVFFVSIKVLAVLLTSLALVYLGYSYWSPLKRKMFGIPYSRSRRVDDEEGDGELGTATTEYHKEENNVNII